jgi:two-component system C4-dicarboxylate transport sensor histidine kinase DctB
MPMTRRSPRHRSVLPIGLALFACLLVGWAVHRLFLGSYLEGERKNAAQRLEFYAVSLEGALDRYEALPWLLALERDLADLLDKPSDPARRKAANHYLETVQGDAALAAAYLIDLKGETLAASNWNLPRSFVGQNYAYRPYFRETINGRLGRFYGIGATTGEAGYFLAAPLRLKERIVGAVAIKVSLDAFEQALARSGDRVLLADADGVVFLASRPEWRYHTLAPLDAAARARLAETRQYAEHPLAPLIAGEYLADSTSLVQITLPQQQTERLFLQSRNVGRQGWRLVLLASPGEAERAARGAGVAAGFAAAFLIVIVVYYRLRRRRRTELLAADKTLRAAHAELEQRIAERTADLSGKLDSLKRTEAILRETRDDAVQAGKLAVLGQMAAGITHELNQPLAALHTLSDNAVALIDLGRLDEARENLELISQTISRTGRIITQLKSFARKGQAEKSPVVVRNAIEHALLIIEPRRREIGRCGARIEIEPIADTLCIFAETVRIEQVLVNLLRNGLDAMAGDLADEPLLTVTAGYADADQQRVRIAVRDHGPGIPEAVLPHLFEPFYTTKPIGEGLGLGLAISLAIVESFGGQLEARNAEGGGAEFSVLLDACPKE